MRENDASFRREVCARIADLSASAVEPVVLGFDGFVDHIIDAVDLRDDPRSYRAMTSLRDFGGRVSCASGKGTNIELVVRQTKIGGNGPITALAMARLGHPLTYLGPLGEEGVDPVFAGLADQAREVISLGPPAVTDAVEFHDGKLMLGKLASLDGITPERLESVVGKRRMGELLAGAAGIATLNWTMVLGMSDIWRWLLDEVLPRRLVRRPRWFIDLADPAKRPAEDLHRAMRLLGELQAYADVILSVNEEEARQVLASLHDEYPRGAGELPDATAAALRIREALGIDRAIVHLIPSSGSAGPDGTAGSVGFSTPTPHITTGGGDHFNAGFFAALLQGLDDEACHLVANAVSGFYVRRGHSPGWQEVAEFMAGWSE